MSVVVSIGEGLLAIVPSAVLLESGIPTVAALSAAIVGGFYSEFIAGWHGGFLYLEPLLMTDGRAIAENCVNFPRSCFAAVAEPRLGGG